MMNFGIRNILMSAFCLAATAVSGQITTREGYIITLENDTIFGRLEYANSGYLNKCVLGKGDSPKIEWLKPGDIKGYYVNPDIQFSSTKCQGEDMFLRVLSEGKINLYTDKLDLYVSNNTDSVVRLAGGKEYCTVNGQQYAQRVNTFKTQIWVLTSDRNYYQRIEELNYDQVKITALIKEINGSEDDSDIKIRSGNTIHQGHFGFEAGLSFNSFLVENMPDRYDTLLISMVSDEKHKVNSWFAGVNYKWKLGKGNSYLSGALDFELMSGNSQKEEGVIHSTTMHLTDDGNLYYIDTVGTVTDTYSFNMVSLCVPLVFHKEMSYNMLRPFFDLGFLVRFNFRNEGSLKRTIVFSESTENEEYRMHIPAFMSGVRAGAGVRWLINMNYSVSAGVSAEITGFGSDSQGLYHMVSKRTYLSFNF